MWIRKSTIEAMQRQIGVLATEVGNLRRMADLSDQLNEGVDKIGKPINERPLNQEETIAEIKRLIQDLSINYGVGRDDSESGLSEHKELFVKELKSANARLMIGEFAAKHPDGANIIRIEWVRNTEDGEKVFKAQSIYLGS